MHKLTPPDFSALDVLKNSIANSCDEQKSKLQDQTLRTALLNAEQTYVHYLQAGQAWQVPKSDDVAGVLTKDDALSIYEEMKDLPFRNATAAELLYKNARLTRCAYCGHNQPRNLDHYLPKYKYVEYAFCPKNLVPACDACNTFAGGKGKLLPRSAGEFFYHPYFDDPDDGRWLKVVMSVTESGLDVHFETQKPIRWSNEKYGRIEYTFKKLKLSKMYSEAVLADISARRTVLGRLFDLQGGGGLATHFGSIATDYLADCPNGWIPIAYEYLSCHQEVCDAYRSWLL